MDSPIRQTSTASPAEPEGLLLSAKTAVNPLNPYNLREALEILDVMGLQATNAVGQHGADDIGIVDLRAADLEVQQHTERGG